MTQDKIVIREVRPQDMPSVHTLNQSLVPMLGSATPEKMRWYAENSTVFRVVEAQDRLAGFYVAMLPEVEYGSPNFLWFKSRYPSFLYIDRIAVTPEFRRLGLGALMYDDAASFAKGKAPLLTCEVNIRPRNDVSLAFHTRVGFREVGTQDTEGGALTVALMVRDI